jgi:hypothetical protein
MISTATIYSPAGKSRILEANHAAEEVRRRPGEWSFTKPPPIGWERETPKYRAAREVHPAQKVRFRFEPPFAMTIDNSAWQYGTRVIAAGEIVETREWPHPSFHPLNYAAEKVLDFFNNRQKSRLPRSPFYGDSLRLSDGMSGPMVVKPTLPQLQPMDLRSAS